VELRYLRASASVLWTRDVILTTQGATQKRLTRVVKVMGREQMNTSERRQCTKASCFGISKGAQVEDDRYLT
jgi:hypothetical protein